jgi:hypothetical protein
MLRCMSPLLGTVIVVQPPHVRCRRRSGKHLISASISHFDAVDDAHSATSRCHRVVALEQPSAMSAVRSLSGVDRTPRLPPNSDENDPTRTSALRHPGQPQALNRAVAPGKEGRIVAPCIRGITKATNGEAWIERKSGLHRGSRLIQLPEPRQRSR